MNRTAHLAGIGFAVIFGFTFLFSKIALAYVSPVGLISYRFLIAFLVFELLRRLKIVKIRFRKGQWKAWLPVALCEPILYFLFETYGLDRTASGEAGLMIALIPVFVPLLGGVLLHERPRPLQWLFIVLSVAGIGVVSFAGEGEAASGDLLGFFLLFAAVLSAAGFTIASRKASETLRPDETTYFMMLSAAVVFNLIYLGELAFGAGIGTYFTALWHAEIVVPILYLGVVASIGGFFLVNFALSRLPAHVSSIYSNLSTVVAIAAGALVLNEVLALPHLVGSVMILAGVYGTVRSGRRPAVLDDTKP